MIYSIFDIRRCCVSRRFMFMLLVLVLAWVLVLSAGVGASVLVGVLVSVDVGVGVPSAVAVVVGIYVVVVVAGTMCNRVLLVTLGADRRASAPSGGSRWAFSSDPIVLHLAPI